MTEGARLLRAWLSSSDERTVSRLARQFGISSQAVSQWLSGVTRPHQIYREQLAKLAAIPIWAWETREDRQRRHRMTK